jgi:hypothetical protein
MFRSERAGLLRPKRVWLALGWVLLALAPLLAASMFFTKGATSGLTFYAVFFGAMSLSYGMRSIKGAKTDEGALEVRERAITFAGKELVKREEVKQAFVVPQEGAALVRLDRRGKSKRPLFVRLRDSVEAEAFVRALGLDAEHTAAEMRVASSLLGWSIGKQLLAVLLPLAVTLPLMIALMKIAPLALILPFFYIAYVFAIGFAPTTVRIGTDGIVTRWLGRTRFVAHADIERVASYDDVRGTKRQRGVRLDLKNGEVVRLPTGQHDVALSEGAQLERRIDEAREAHRRGAKGGATDVLARGDRSIAEWIRHLRGVGAGAVSLRTPAIPADVLLRVVEDSKAAPIERASAAVAAIAAGGDEVKQRVRVAADTTVSPKLRVALERIASGAEETDEALVETLDELDDVNAGRRAS